MNFVQNKPVDKHCKIFETEGFKQNIAKGTFLKKQNKNGILSSIYLNMTDSEEVVNLEM